MFYPSFKKTLSGFYSETQGVIGRFIDLNWSLEAQN